MEHKRYRPDLPDFFKPYVDKLRKMSLEDVEGLINGKEVNVLANDTVTDTNDYESKGVLTALDQNGKLMTIDQYCEFYGLDRTRVSSEKLVTHTGIPYYNIAFRDKQLFEQVDLDEVKQLIAEGFEGVSYHGVGTKGNKIGVVKIADLHLGALVEDLLKTKDFSVNILSNKLIDAASIINRLDYKEVHVHIIGDLIESFTGLNHINSWKSLEKGMFGAEAVKVCVKILHEYFLSNIYNLNTVKIVAGNHDRVTSNNKEDVSGDAANLIAWGLELIGYDVEFNPAVITHKVDGINYINTHGHLGISKMSTKDICWDYGEQGVFNVIAEGHLHSLIQKLSASKRNKFQTVKDSAVDHLRFNCQSFFTGNQYSENLGYTSNSGFSVFENNGKGVPHQFNFHV